MNRATLRFVQHAVVAGALALAAPSAHAQFGPPAESAGRPAPTATAPSITPALDAVTPANAAELNPMSVLAAVGDALPAAPGANPGEKGQGLSTTLNIVLLLTVITLVPSIMLMTTCFIRIIIVLGLLRQALGTQQLPPPQVLLGMSLFMTLLVMAPTIDRLNTEAIAPYRAGEIRDYDALWARVRAPVRDFMFDQIEATGNWSSVYMILDYRGVPTDEPEKLTRSDVDMISLIPAFMLSELKTAFLIGFRVYLPFLVIDMVVSTILISMSMMMLPPVLISLPFKLLLFVLVDGWTLVVGSLMTSFKTGPVATAMMQFAPSLGAGFG